MYEKEVLKHGSVILSPYIVGIRGFLKTDDLFGIVMELMQGSLWDFRVKKFKGVPQWPIVWRMSHHMAQGMKFLHSKGIIHRDLKLQNVLFSSRTLDVKVKLSIKSQKGIVNIR